MPIETVNLNECNTFEEVTKQVNLLIDEVNALSFVHELSDEVKELSKAAAKEKVKASEILKAVDAAAKKLAAKKLATQKAAAEKTEKDKE